MEYYAPEYTQIPFPLVFIQGLSSESLNDGGDGQTSRESLEVEKKGGIYERDSEANLEGTPLHRTSPVVSTAPHDLRSLFCSYTPQNLLWDDCLLSNPAGGTPRPVLSLRFVSLEHALPPRLTTESPLSAFALEPLMTLLDQRWLTKHYHAIPSVLIEVYEINGGITDPQAYLQQDAMLAQEIGKLKQQLAAREIRLIPLVVCTQPAETPGLSARIANIRKLTLFGPRLVYLPAGTRRELEVVVEVVMTTARSLSAEYYAGLEKRLRRRKANPHGHALAAGDACESNSAPPNPEPVARLTPYLTPLHLEARQLLKLAVVAQLRATPDAAVKLLEQAHRALLQLLLLKPLGPANWLNYRLLLDTAALHATRLHLALGFPNVAYTRFDAHLQSVAAAMGRAHVPTSKIWLAAQYEWLAELVARCPPSVVDFERSLCPDSVGGVGVLSMPHPGHAVAKSAELLTRVELSADAYFNHVGDIPQTRLRLLKKAERYFCVLPLNPAVFSRAVAYVWYLKGEIYRERVILSGENLNQMEGLNLGQMEGSNLNQMEGLNLNQMEGLNLKGVGQEGTSNQTKPSHETENLNLGVNVNLTKNLNLAVAAYLACEQAVAEAPALVAQVRRRLVECYARLGRDEDAARVFLSGCGGGVVLSLDVALEVALDVECLFKHATAVFSEPSAFQVTVAWPGSLGGFQLELVTIEFDRGLEPITVGCATGWGCDDAGISLPAAAGVPGNSAVSLPFVVEVSRVATVVGRVSIVGVRYAGTVEVGGRTVTVSGCASPKISLDRRHLWRGAVDQWISAARPWSTVVEARRPEVQVTWVPVVALQGERVDVAVVVESFDRQRVDVDVTVEKEGDAGPWGAWPGDGPLALVDVKRAERSLRVLVPSWWKEPELQVRLKVIFYIEGDRDIPVVEYVVVRVAVVDAFRVVLGVQPRLPAVQPQPVEETSSNNAIGEVTENAMGELTSKGLDEESTSKGLDEGSPPSCLEEDRVSSQLDSSSRIHSSLAGSQPEGEGPRFLPRTWCARVSLGYTNAASPITITNYQLLLKHDAELHQVLCVETPVEARLVLPETSTFLQRMFTTRPLGAQSPRNLSVECRMRISWSRPGSLITNELMTPVWKLSLPMLDPRVVLTVGGSALQLWLVYTIENPTGRVFTFSTVFGRFEEYTVVGDEALEQTVLVPPYGRVPLRYTVEPPRSDGWLTLPELKVLDLKYKVSLPTLMGGDAMRLGKDGRVQLEVGSMS